MNQLLGSLRGQKVCMVHSNILYTLLVTLLHYAGSIEEPHHIRESGKNKSVWFKATVSYFIVGEIYTCTILILFTDTKLYKVHSVSCRL